MSHQDRNELLRMKGYEYRERNYDKAVIAIGSTEYHGDHLPYGTDTLVSEHLARQLASKVQGILMLPTIPIGMSAHYSSFPISLSLKTETLMHILTEVFDSLNRHAMSKLLIINGHDGNIPAIQAATNEYHSKNPEFKIVVLEAWWETAGKLVPEGTFEVWGGLGHGGEGETSMMLSVDKRLVDMGRAKGVVPRLPEHVQYTWTFDELTPYGATGDPSKASEEKGKLMDEALISLLVKFVKEMDEKNWTLDQIYNTKKGD
jgi:creatinine amidohydrolase